MGDKTAIEWTGVPDGAGGYKRGATWNPLRGCTEVSAGCDHCYAASVAFRFSGPGQPYAGLATQDARGHPQWTGAIMLVESHLADPLRWREPRGVFVNSMSDLFHPDVPDDYIERVFAVMALSQRHTFQILTKRPQRMANWLVKGDPLASRAELVAGTAAHMGGIVWDARGDDPNNYLLVPGFKRGQETNRRRWPGWPLPNVWVGTSVEDQRATSRIKALLRCPAAIRFLSCEPLLGPIDLGPFLWDKYYGDAEDGSPIAFEPAGNLHWVIVGGESGRYARPFDPDWARSIRDDCARAQVPYFFKQVGGLTPKSGGDLLDGVRHHQFPE